MRRIISVFCICICLLKGCGTRYEDTKDTLKETNGGYFTQIKEWNDEYGHFYHIVYANDTKVKYLIHSRGGITPLYNADGSLQVYEEESKNDENNRQSN